MANPTSPDPLALWSGEPSIKPVLAEQAAHTLHSYFGISPESPDERSVLLFRSSQADAHRGDVITVDRATSAITTLATGIETEDGHRQANQQWTCGGEYVVFMSYDSGTWRVERVRADDPRDRQTLATGRQLGWGQPHLDEVPLYGPHWNPGPHRDLELLNVRTGQVRTVITAGQVRADLRQMVDQLFGDRPLSLFFPQVSPDGSRVFLKLAAVKDGQFRSPAASDRDGLVVYDLRTGRCLGANSFWGHPAWFADSRRIQSVQFIIDTDTMAITEVPGLPRPLGGIHASRNPDATLIVTDISRKDYLPQRNHWTIMLIDPADGRRHILHIAPVDGDGTSSWRPVHPHPSFNAHGNRIYFNLINRPWTTLHVAEPAAGHPSA